MVAPLRSVSLLVAVAISVAAASLAAAEEGPTGGRRIAKLLGPSGTDVVFSRDGRFILTAGSEEARVWDARSFAAVSQPLQHPAPILRATLSADGTRVLTAAGDDARLWDAGSGECLFALNHPAEVRWVSFSDDGTKIVTGGDDGFARVWEAQSGKLLSTFEHKLPVQWARLIDRSNRLFTFSAPTKRDPVDGRERGGWCHAWDVSRGEEVFHRWADGEVFSTSRRRWEMPVDISPNGRLGAATYMWLATLWESDSGDAVMSIDGRARPDGDFVRWPGLPCGALFSPDGRRLAFATFGGVAVLDVERVIATDGEERKPISIVDVRDPETLAFSPDGKLLIIGASDGGSGVWDVDKERCLIGSAREAGESPAVAFGPDGKRVAAGFPSDGFTGVWLLEKPPTGLSLVAATNKRRVKVGETVTLTLRVENEAEKDILVNFRSGNNCVRVVEDGDQHPTSVPGLPAGWFASQHEALPVPPKGLPEEKHNDDQREAARLYTIDYSFTLDRPGVYQIFGEWTSEDLSRGEVEGIFVGELRSNIVEVEVVGDDGAGVRDGVKPRPK